MTQFQDPFRSVAQRSEETYAQLAGQGLSPIQAAPEATFSEASGASLRTGPTQRILRSQGFFDYAGDALAVMLPEWAGGITVDEFDSIGPITPQPFDMAEEIRRLQPERQRVAMSVLESGALDSIVRKDEFTRIIDDAMDVDADLQKINAYAEQKGFLKSMGAAIVGGTPDPIYLIPIGGQAARGAMTLNAGLRFFATQGAIGMAGGAAINLGTKKLVDETSYGLTDLPGIGDEALVAAVGGGFGAVMPVLGYSARYGMASTVNALSLRGVNVPFGLPRWALRWGSQEHLEAVFKKMNTTETPMLQQAASAEGADAALRELGGTIRYDDERARSLQILDDFIDDARKGRYHENLSLALLYKGADDPEIVSRINKLRGAYKRHRQNIRAAGGSNADDFVIRQQSHTAQEGFDRLNDLRYFFNEDPRMKSIPARAFLLNLFADVGDALPTGSTPATRAGKYANRMYDIMRALSASFSDYTPRDLKLFGGARSSAESVKDGLDLLLAASNREMMKILRESGQVGMVRTRLPEANQTLNEAFGILVDRMNGVSGPYRNPAAVRVADTMDRYFQRMKRELVDAGLFVDDPMSRPYVPIAINERAASGNQDAFRIAAIAQFRFMDAHNLPNQVRLDALARAYDRTTDAAIRNDIVTAVRNHVADPTFTPKDGTEIRARLEDPGVSMLPAPSAFSAKARTAYQDSLKAVYREGADDLLRRMIDPAAESKTFESVTTAGKPDAFKERTFNVIAPELRPFLLSDPVALMRRYGAQVHGQIGIARAIRMHPEIFGKMVVRDGGREMPVTNAEDLMRWYIQAENAFNEFAGKRGVGLPAADRARSAVTGLLRDQRAVVKRLLGQALYEGGAKPSDLTMFTTRTLSTLALTVNGGMMGVSNLSDIVGKLAWTVMHPVRGFPIMAETFGPVLNRLKKRDLEFLHLTSQMSMLPREFTEYGMHDRGFGTGFVRSISGGFDYVREGIGRSFGRFIGLDLVNTINGRWGAAIAMDEMITLSKRLVRAQRAGARDPIKAAGLTETQVAALARLGIRKTNARKVLEQVHKHGVHWDRTSASARTFDEFLESNSPVNPLFDLWDGALEERRFLSDNIANEARRVLNVVPGVADRPVVEDTAPMLRIVNQFSSFAYAYNKQRLRPLAQKPIAERSMYLGTQLMMGWMMYAAKNDLTERKPFAESVRELVEDPQAAAWGAAQDSMVLGNFMRAVGYYDRLAMPIGLSSSQVMGQTVAGGTFGSVTREQQTRDVSGAELMMSFAGAGPQLMTRLAEAALNKDSARQDYLEAQSVPLQNVIWARLLNRAGVSRKIDEAVGPIPGLVPADIYRPRRPTLGFR